MGNKN